jgi:hypothetical protein
MEDIITFNDEDTKTGVAGKPTESVLVASIWLSDFEATFANVGTLFVSSLLALDDDARGE